MSDPYARNRASGKRESGLQRIVVLMRKEEVEALDQWGIPAGMESRTATVRELLRRGLDASKAQQPAHS